MDSTAQWTDVNCHRYKGTMHTIILLEQTFTYYLCTYQLSNEAIIVLDIDEYFVGFIIIIRYVRR